jgi:hypothetical protein
MLRGQPTSVNMRAAAQVLVPQSAQVAFEMPEVDRVEAHQGGEQPDIGFGELREDEEPLLGKTRL